MYVTCMYGDVVDGGILYAYLNFHGLLSSVEVTGCDGEPDV